MPFPSRAKPREPSAAPTRHTQKLSFSSTGGVTTPPTTFIWIYTAQLRAQPQATSLFMGVSGYISSVDSGVFDTVWTVENGMMTMQTNLDMHGHLLLKTKLGGDLDLNYKKVHSNGLALFRAGVTGMTMETGDLGGFSLHQPKLGDDLDLDGHFVKDRRATLFGGTNGPMTRQKDLNMNSYLD